MQIRLPNSADAGATNWRICAPVGRTSAQGAQQRLPAIAAFTLALFFAFAVAFPLALDFAPASGKLLFVISVVIVASVVTITPSAFAALVLPSSTCQGV